MTSEGRKCGLGSLISMSCKGRAEAFARRLHTKLISLGSDGDDGAACESSWLTANENPVASQPRHHVQLADLEMPQSPASEEEEEHIRRQEERALVNGDPLRYLNGDETEKNFMRSSTSLDSDSDCSFYDTENETDQRPASRATDAEVQEDSYASVSDSTPQPCSPLSEDPSTLSLQDGAEEEEEECPSLDDVARLCDNDVSIGDESIVDDDDDEDESEQQEKEPVCTSPSACWSVAAEFDDVEDAEGGGARRPRVRRCSSLKTGKTPPETPATKKIVRFADVLGLDLADVRTFLDEVPQVPVSAFEDLPDADLSESPDSEIYHQSAAVGKLLVPLFPQPAGQPDFLERVRENQVCLENALVDDAISLSVTGTVRVRNLDFHKSVHIRYSLDAWKTFADVQALYLDNSCDGFSDRFAFLLYAHSIGVGQRLEFACRFQCRGCQYWDSNRGANYCFQCLPADVRSSGDASSGIDDWGASFYYLGMDPDGRLLRDHVMDAMASRGVPKAPKENSNSAVFIVVLVLSFLFLCLHRAAYIL